MMMRLQVASIMDKGNESNLATCNLQPATLILTIHFGLMLVVCG